MVQRQSLIASQLNQRQPLPEQWLPSQNSFPSFLLQIFIESSCVAVPQLITSPWPNHNEGRVGGKRESIDPVLLSSRLNTGVLLALTPSQPEPGEGFVLLG